jgi:hypothetical protein
MTRTIIRTAVVAAAVAALLAGGAAIAQTGAPGTTGMTVGPRVELPAGAINPTEFPGVHDDRRGQPIPSRFRAISYAVSITRGTTETYPTFTVRCPAGRTLFTFASTGGIGPQIVGYTPFIRRRGFDYSGKSSWGVVADYNRRDVKVGETVTGTVYALCR